MHSDRAAWTGYMLQHCTGSCQKQALGTAQHSQTLYCMFDSMLNPCTACFTSKHDGLLRASLVWNCIELTSAAEPEFISCLAIL